MTGAAVNWGLGTTLAMVASVAAWRLARTPLFELDRGFGAAVGSAPLGADASRREPCAAAPVKFEEPRPTGRRSRANKRADPLLHLAMALGMASMLAPVGGSTTAVVATGFGIAAVGLLARSRPHHAIMSGIMALMMLRGRMTAGSASARAATMPMPMPTPSSGHGGVSLLLLAAFGYAAVSACVLTWRMPAAVSYGARRGLHTCAIDPLGRGCEIVMLVSTAVMLLPMI